MYRRILRSRLSFVFLFGCSSLLVACNSGSVRQGQAGVCPQIRTTEMAPAVTASLSNPLATTQDNIDAGERLYLKTAQPVACVECHGEYGDGNGLMADMFSPAPRNFTCAEVVDPLPDGQLYWIIKYGSIGTSMPAFDKLSDEQIWQLTLYLRSFSQPQTADVPVVDGEVSSSL